MHDFVKKVGIYSLIYLYVLSIQSISFANAESISQNALPTNGIVKSGSASISQTSNTMNVNQSSNNAIISWNKFNIGSKATVNFNQPSSSSNTLNRVRSSDPSRIYGNLNANGNIFFINPNGVLVGKSGSINVGGLVASTMNMANNDFNKQNYNFNSSSKSSIINYGNVNSKYVALLSSDVKNYGSISATSGTAAIVSGDNAKLSLSSNGKLNIKVSESKLANLIENEGTIKSENGQVLIKSSAAKSLVDATIKGPSGKKKLVSVNGVLKLVSNSGEIKANSVKIDAGQNGMVSNSGSIDVSSKNSNGGNIEVTGKEISIKSGSKLLASGKTGGGDVLIGGDWKGSGDLLQSTYPTVEKNTLIDASSSTSGDGGKIVVWSDIKNSKSKTSVNGTLLAYAVDGDGGKIETSGATLEHKNIKINASSKNGKSGLWLIDPYTYTIGGLSAGTIELTLAMGTSVSVLTSANSTGYGSGGDSNTYGDITLNNSINYRGSSDVTLTLNAARNITVASGASIIDTGSGKLGVKFISGGSQTINGTISVAGTVDLKTTTYKLTKNVYGDSSSTTYTYSTSGVHTLTLASGYSSGTFDIRGAQGGANSRGTMGGKGGKVTGSFSNLSAGSVLKIYVGGVGGNGKQGQSYTSYTAGGYNGGGTGGNKDQGGGGGGATDIRLDGTALTDRIAVAGGGGGRGGDPSGQAGGIGGNTGSSAGTAGDGTDDPGGPYGGKGGTQSAGGAGGNGQISVATGQAGTLGQGGNGGYTRPQHSYDGGGGGGGGYYGGGGGGASDHQGFKGDGAGGGGGSSFASSTYTSSNTFTGGSQSTNGYAQLVITTRSVSEETDSGTGNIVIGTNAIKGGKVIVTSSGTLSTKSLLRLYKTDFNITGASKGNISYISTSDSNDVPKKVEKIAPKIRKQIRKEVRKETRKLRKEIKKEIRQQNRNPNNQGSLVANVGGKMTLTPAAMAKFSSVKLKANSAGIKTNFKALGGTKFASVTPASNFKVNNSSFKITPFKPVTFSTTGINFKIPAKNIEIPASNTKVDFDLKLKNGSPLPDWVKFDSNTLQISGKPPEGFSGSLELNLVATSDNGTQQAQDIQFTVSE